MNVGWGTGGKVEGAGFLLSGTNGTTINSSTTAHTKGSWTQLIAATANAWTGFVVHAVEGNGGNLIFDIGIGGAGAEQVIASNVVVNQAAACGRSIYIPIYVPAGVRVSSRCQSNLGGANQGMLCNVYGLAAGAMPAHPIFQRAEAVGADTSNSRGTQIDAGATINTKGSWVQLTASLTNNARAICPIVGYANALPAGSLSDALRFSFDIGVGAGGSEQIVLPDINTLGNEFLGAPSFSNFLFPVGIAAGARIAARCSASNNNATYRVGNISLMVYS